MYEHWLDVRKGTLLNLGQQLRLGRYPGFEEGASSSSSSFSVFFSFFPSLMVLVLRLYDGADRILTFDRRPLCPTQSGP